MSTYSLADTRTQWFADDFPGARIDPNCGVIHTTEGTNWPSYDGGAKAPNYTNKPDFTRKRLMWRAHFPDEMSSRALRNLAGGVETNTANAVQVELIGTCAPATRDEWVRRGLKQNVDFIFWPQAPDWALRDLATFIADMNRRHGIDIDGPALWKPYPDSFGADPNRFTFAEWRAFFGWCGHQHVPENSHGDPGALPWAKVQQLAREMVQPKTAQRSLRGGSFNLLVGRDPQVVKHEVTALLRKWDLDFLVVEESTEYKAVLRAIPGYRYLTGQSTNGGAESEVGILVRDGVKVNWYANAAYGDGWLRAPFFRTRMRPRVLPRVTLDGWLRVCGVHMPAAVNLRTCTPSDRFDDYVALMRKVGRFLEGRGARLAVGDWNQLRDNNRTHSPRWTAERSGAVLVSPDRRIDYVLAARCEVQNIRKDHELPEASDHEPVVFTVRKP